jgi:ABC-type branched-subunit amino acid transport system substrate-binding protein
LKRILFLVISTLLVLGLVLPGCTGGPVVTQRPNIIIGMPYPAGSVQGDGMTKGAELAVAQINVNGVNVTVAGNTTLYNFKLVERNDNEIANPPDAYNALNYLISTSHAQFIIGGFRTEAVEPMIQLVLKTTPTPFFICGAATTELLAGGLSGDSIYPTGYGTPYAYGYNASSDFYKYIFRATPFNSGFLLGMVMSVFAQVSEQIQTAMNWTYNASAHAWPQKVNVAIFAENLTWALPIIGGYQKLLNQATGYGALFGWNLTTTFTCSDNPQQSVVDAGLTAIKAQNNQIILTCMSGPVGETFGKRMAALNVTAIPVGINVEAQDPNYGINTGSQYEVTTGTWAHGVNNTALTAAFLSAYDTAFGSFPVYTAASYDMVYTLKDAIETTDSLNKDDVCNYLLTHARTNTAGYAAYYPVWDQTTNKGHLITYSGSPSFLQTKLAPALNASQVATIYTALGYNAAYNYTMGPFTTNDLIFGPGYVTGICVQWIKTGPTSYTQVGIWPNAGFDVPVNADVPIKIQTSLVRALCGLNWSNTLEYPGTSNAVIPAAYIAVW